MAIGNDHRTHTRGDSLLIATVTAGETVGEFVELPGRNPLPITDGMVTVGEATGGPDDFTVVLSLEQADADESNVGTVPDIAPDENDVLQDSLTITKPGTYWVRFEKRKAKLRAKVNSTFDGGSSPAVPVSVATIRDYTQN